MADNRDILINRNNLSAYHSSLLGTIQKSMLKEQYDALTTINPYTSYYLTDKHVIMLNGVQYGASPEDDYVNLTSSQVINGNKAFTLRIEAKGGLKDANNPDNIFAFPKTNGTLALKSDIPEYLSTYIKSATIDNRTLKTTNVNGTVTTYSPTFGDVMTYHGIKASGSLPTSGNEKGDYYNLSDLSGYCAIWNGSAWQQGKYTPTYSTSISSSDRNMIQNKVAYNYIVNYDDTTKLNRNGSNNITGTQVSNITGTLGRDVTNSSLVLLGGNARETGAHLVLNGKDWDNGSFELVACQSGSEYSSLRGYPNGTLTWRGGIKFDANRIDDNMVPSGTSGKNWGKVTIKKCIKLAENLYYIFMVDFHEKYMAANWAEHMCDSLKIDGKAVVSNIIFPGYMSNTKKDINIRTTGSGKVLMASWGDAPKDLWVAIGGIVITA